MKILLLGDASNYHPTLAIALKDLGHEVTVASDGSGWINTPRDIDLSRRDNKLGGALLYMKLLAGTEKKLRGFDIVQFYNPLFLPLRPERHYRFLDSIKKHNGRLFLTALATDPFYVQNLTGPQPALSYSEWHTPKGPSAWSKTTEARKDDWLAKEIFDYTKYFYQNIEGAVSALFEYHKVFQATHPHLPLAYAGIPILTQGIQQKIRKDNDKLTILAAAPKKRAGEKGAKTLYDLAAKIEANFPNTKLISPPNMPYSNFVDLLGKIDIDIDQLYSFTPATTALLSMARGAITVSGAEEEFYNFIGEKTLRPIINANPFDIDHTYKQLARVVSDAEYRRELSRQSIEFVARHNEAHIVARRFINFWDSL